MDINAELLAFLEQREKEIEQEKEEIAAQCEEKKSRAFSLRSGMTWLGPAVKSALSWAHYAACERSKHVYGTLNLLSALLADERGMAAEIFRRSNWEPSKVRRVLQRRIERNFPSNN